MEHLVYTYPQMLAAHTAKMEALEESGEFYADPAIPDCFAKERIEYLDRMPVWLVACMFLFTLLAAVAGVDYILNAVGFRG